MSKSAIAISNLSYTYRSDWKLQKICALEPFSLSVQEGEAFGFLGHNGAGKTTTIKCILGLIKPKSGSVAIFGKTASDPESRRALGYIPEQPYFYENLTVRETLQYFARLYGIHGIAAQRKIAELAERVGIEQKLSTSLRTLSKGLTQRVALAQALISEPRVLILDEPFSGLDPIGRKQFRDIFAEYKKKGTTLFISSHVLGDVEALCDRVSILVRGALKGVFAIADIPRYSGARFELVLRNASQSTVEEQRQRFEFTTRDHAEVALRRALEAKQEVESYQMVHGSLEDLFVRLVEEGNTK